MSIVSLSVQINRLIFLLIPLGQEPAPAAPGTTAPAKTVASVQQKQQELLKSAIEQPFIPKDPPPELEFVADPPSISALDL